MAGGISFGEGDNEITLRNGGMSGLQLMTNNWTIVDWKEITTVSTENWIPGTNQTLSRVSGIRPVEIHVHCGVTTKNREDMIEIERQLNAYVFDGGDYPFTDAGWGRYADKVKLVSVMKPDTRLVNASDRLVPDACYQEFILIFRDMQPSVRRF